VLNGKKGEMIMENAKGMDAAFGRIVERHSLLRKTLEDGGAGGTLATIQKELEVGSRETR